MASIQVSISKLNSQNYGNWAADVKYLLLDKNAWGIVNGTEKAPETTDTAADKDYQSRVRSARSIIYLNVEPEFRRIIENIDDPKEVWKKLKTHFHPDNRSRHMQLFSEVLACRIEADEAIDMYAARLQRIANQLTAMNEPIKETYLSFQLLRWLPKRYDGLVQSILRWSEDKFKFNDILTELIAEESRLKLRSEDRAESIQTNFSRTRPPRNSSYRRKFQGKCHKCGRTGHVKRNCAYSNPETSGPDSSAGNSSRDSSISRETLPRSNPVRPRNRGATSKPKSTFKPQRQHNSQVHYLIQSNLSRVKGDDDAWVFDTGASHHFCKNKDLYVDFKPLRNQELAVAVDGATFPIKGTGTVDLKLNGEKVRFGDVMFCPSLRRNLISGSRLDTKGAKFKGGEGRVKAYREDRTLFRAFLKNGIYYIHPEPSSRTVTNSKLKSNIKPKHVRFEASTIQKDDLKLWHRRLGHISPSLIEHTDKCNGVRGLPHIKNRDFDCEICKLNKHRRTSFKPLKEIRSKKPLELLHTDLWGPTKITGRNGEKYFLTITDDFSRKVAVYPLCNKTQVYKVFTNHVKRAERFLNTKLKSVRSDNGREFSNEAFKNYFEANGIKHEFTNIYTPEQDGVSERLNQTLVDGARSILNESKMNLKFWPEAILYYAYKLNRVCHKSQTKTPFEYYCGNKPSIRHLRPFGSIVYVGVPRQLRGSKFEAKAKKGILVGYAMSTKGYRVWLPDGNKIIETINVRFSNEATLPKDLQNHSEPGPTYSIGTDPFDVAEERNGSGLGPTYIIGTQHPEINPFRELQPDKPPPAVSKPDQSHFDDPVSSRTSLDESDEEGESCSRSLRDAAWFRKATRRRKDKRRNMYYYYEVGGTDKLRSLREVRDYCQKHGIRFDARWFNFKGKDTYEGLVDTTNVSCNSSPSQTPPYASISSIFDPNTASSSKPSSYTTTSTIFEIEDDYMYEPRVNLDNYH